MFHLKLSCIFWSQNLHYWFVHLVNCHFELRRVCVVVNRVVFCFSQYESFWRTSPLMISRTSLYSILTTVSERARKDRLFIYRPLNPPRNKVRKYSKNWSNFNRYLHFVIAFSYCHRKNQHTLEILTSTMGEKGYLPFRLLFNFVNFFIFRSHRFQFQNSKKRDGNIDMSGLEECRPKKRPRLNSP